LNQKALAKIRLASGLGSSILRFPDLHCKGSHKDNIKEDAPHLCFLEPISSLLVKTWTLIEIKDSRQGVLANSVAHSYKHSFLSFHPSEGFALQALGNTKLGMEQKGLHGAMVHWTLNSNHSSLPELKSSISSRPQTGWAAWGQLKCFFILRPNL